MSEVEFLSQIVAPSVTVGGSVGATADGRFVGFTETGPPVSGDFLVGDYSFAQDGFVWYCTVDGSPGTWEVTHAPATEIHTGEDPDPYASVATSVDAGIGLIDGVATDASGNTATVHASPGDGVYLASDNVLGDNTGSSSVLASGSAVSVTVAGVERLTVATDGVAVTGVPLTVDGDQVATEGYADSGDVTSVATAVQRSNHTGSQLSTTISDLTEAVQDIVAAYATQGSNITITYSDVGNTLTFAVSGLASTDLSNFTEAVQDVVGALSGFGGSALTFTYNDAGNTVTLDVNVDGSTIEVSGDALRVKALGITDSHVAAANKDGVAGTASMRTLGTGAQQAAAGNDSRLSDTRTPTDDSVTSAKIAAGAIVNSDVNAAAAIDGSKIVPTFTVDWSAPGGAITDTDGTGILKKAVQAVGTPPVAPAAGNGIDYAWAWAGADVPMWRGATGSARPLLNLPSDRTFRLMRPGSSSTINVLGYGGATNSLGTITTVAGSATAPPLSNLATTAAANADATVARVDNFFRGAATDLFAGFRYYACLKFPDASYNNTGAATGSRIFVGMSSNNPITNDLGKAQHCAMFNRGHVNGAETHTNWQFITNNNGTPGNVIDTGMAFAVAKVYEFRIWCPAGATSIGWQIDNITDSTTATGTTGTQLPGATTGVAQIAQLRTIDAVTRTLQMICTYVEADRG